jgi:hypothetical protein
LSFEERGKEKPDDWGAVIISNSEITIGEKNFDASITNIYKNNFIVNLSMPYKIGKISDFINTTYFINVEDGSVVKIISFLEKGDLFRKKLKCQISKAGAGSDH